MNALERLRAHPKVRDVVEGDDELTVRFSNGDETTRSGVSTKEGGLGVLRQLSQRQE